MRTQRPHDRTIIATLLNEYSWALYLQHAEAPTVEPLDVWTLRQETALCSYRTAPEGAHAEVYCRIVGQFDQAGDCWCRWHRGHGDPLAD
jgi:hypothetical protein